MAFNKSDGVAIVVDNFYSAATGGQDVMSSRADNPSKMTKHPISKALKGIGIGWVREVDRTYDVRRMRDTIREALTTDAPGPKVIVASSECMLNRQRREKPLAQQAIREGRRVEAPRFGVDEAVCTGDHACIRLSGCPVAVVEEARRSAAGRSGGRASTRAAWAAATAGRSRMRRCSARPSTARTWCIIPSPREAKWAAFRARVIGWLQRRREARRLSFGAAA
jgi:indolepyruvate ferredoxin oxidoreductase alpha subunit